MHGAWTDNRLRLDDLQWVRGFFPAALWLARDRTPSSDLFAVPAHSRTLANMGLEGTWDGHDLGFMYELSSVSALRRLCPAHPSCGRLRESGLAAADRLMQIAATNPAAGMVPTAIKRPSTSEADVIIDSLMNMPLLVWASETTGDASYRDTALKHAKRVAHPARAPGRLDLPIDPSRPRKRKDPLRTFHQAREHET